MLYLDDSDANQILYTYDKMQWELWYALRMSQEKDCQSAHLDEYSWASSTLLDQFTVGLNQYKDENIIKNTSNVIEEAQKSGLSNIWWLVNSETSSDPLSRQLLSRGFETMWDKPIMAISLDSLKKPSEGPIGLVIKHVTNDEIFKEWTEVQKKASPEMNGLWHYVYITESGHGFSDVLPMRRYVGYIDGSPISASYGLMAYGAVGLFHVACLPSMGRRGIGTEMSLIPLREARDRGYKVGILDSTEMGFKVYTRIGFKEVGRHRIYKLNVSV